jgi:glycosyltransferase involved in cell wall biosynthesis
MSPPICPPKCSILLPTHNRAEVVCFAIESVLSQTLPDFELLVAGDGCTDETAKVVAGFSDPRIRWFDLPKAPNFGYANRNVALREAIGEFVAFMPHDDLWLPDHLELLIRALEQKGAEIAYSLPLWVIPSGLIAPLVFNLHDPETLAQFLSMKRNGIPGASIIHRRECLEKYGYWNEDLPSCGDWDLWVRIIDGGGRKNFAHIPEATCLHFRASWRTDANAGPLALRVWRGLHSLDNFMPSELKLMVPPGMTEQEACWLAIQEAPQRWTAALRDAVHSVIERRIRLSDERLIRLLRNSDQISPDQLLES